ncbi:nitroreductase/quinone reductase family protein [Chloroflexota bacterium]
MVTEYEWLLMGAWELDLITTDRKNGLPRTDELWFGYQNDYVYLLSGLDASRTPTHWYRNLQAHAQAILRVKGRNVSVQAEPVSEEDHETVTNHTLELLLTKYGLKVMWQRYEGCEFLPIKLRVMV